MFHKKNKTSIFYILYSLYQLWKESRGLSLKVSKYDTFRVKRNVAFFEDILCTFHPLVVKRGSYPLFYYGISEKSSASRCRVLGFRLTEIPNIGLFLTFSSVTHSIKPNKHQATHHINNTLPPHTPQIHYEGKITHPAMHHALQNFARVPVASCKNGCADTIAAKCVLVKAI